MAEDSNQNLIVSNKIVIPTSNEEVVAEEANDLLPSVVVDAHQNRVMLKVPSDFIKDNQTKLNWYFDELKAYRKLISSNTCKMVVL